MIPRPFRIALVSFVLCIPLFAAAQLSIRDDVGRSLSIKKPATRVVSLAPSLTEIAYAAGLGDVLVAVDDLSEYPPQAKALPRIKVSVPLVIDQLALHKPDLVLAWRDGIRPEDVDRIAAFGADVFVAQARALEDVPRLMRSIATLAGRDGNRAARGFEERIEALRKTYEKRPRVPVFVEIWSRPLTTISGAHFLSEGLELCRADNVFKERIAMAPVVTVEDVNGMNPWVIIGAGSSNTAEEFQAEWAIRPAIAAVQAKRLIYIDEESLQRPTPRTPENLSRLCAALDPMRPQLAGPALVPSTRLEAPPPAGAAPQPLPPEQPKPAPGSRPSQYGM